MQKYFTATLLYLVDTIRESNVLLRMFNNYMFQK